jgi:hypothetical protein
MVRLFLMASAAQSRRTANHVQKCTPTPMSVPISVSLPDTVLPRLIFGKLRLSSAEAVVEEAMA